MRHYAGSTACSPSQATIFTGQSPSLHGVTQTDGVAKSAFDPDLFWLDRNTVPTMGNYFRTAGYRTFYKGKWHISQEGIPIPGTRNSFPSYNPVTGVPDPEGVIFTWRQTAWTATASTGGSGRNLTASTRAIPDLRRLSA